MRICVDLLISSFAFFVIGFMSERMAVESFTLRDRDRGTRTGGRADCVLCIVLDVCVVYVYDDTLGSTIILLDARKREVTHKSHKPRKKEKISSSIGKHGYIEPLSF